MKRQEELRKQAEKIEEETFKPWTNTTDSISTTTANIIDELELVEENAVGKLIEALEELWDKFLNSISSSVSDYLSMEHLGIILDKLNEKAQKDMTKLNRKFFAAFTEGEPNLIICSQSEILNTVLSVYNQGDTVSLPFSDEVLVCTNTTSFDMLEIFWRRSLFSRSHRIYCLVNADLLNYDVSDKSERALERFMQHPSTNDNKYRLVVICSSENEYKSRIVAFLAKYHKQQLPTDVQNIRNYLVKEFASQEEEIEILKACIVDHERCNVRVVKSWRAGVGKTLYKKRMVEKLLQCFPNMERKKPVDISVTLHDKMINTDDVMDVFIEETLAPSHKEPRIIHIDISHEVNNSSLCVVVLNL
ncbi:RNF213 [Mytilus coruscus]|uniref:RNF213 n=1 Tax=Mytilus coruscus TaxID=42192 RepID=A0A6J8E550_MYTCO|nr:RNF213 [Mytilus coruscus]